MRFLHTADWHLGRHFHGSSLLHDQAHVLDQFVDLAAREKVDAVVVAGDIYDRAVPPGEAVALLGDVLERLVLREKIPVLLIAGNHDSAERIAFGGGIFAQQRLFLRGTLGNFSPITIEGVDFHPLPYVEPAFARALAGGEAVSDHASAMAHALSLVHAQRRAGRRQVLVGHAFVAGGSESESERPLSVGGSGMVSPELFQGFDYVALGHLHRPQQAGAAHIRYAGSLLKYSFQEADHDKSVSLVEVAEDGRCVATPHRLSPRRGLRVARGTLSELLAAPGHDDWLCAELTDPGPVLEPMARLRERYPQALEVRFVRESQAGTAARSTAAGDHRRRRPLDLFQAFWRDVGGGGELSAEEVRAFERCADAGAEGAP